MSNYFYGKIEVINDITKTEMSPEDLLFSVEGSSVTLSFSDNLIVSTSDKDLSGQPISYQIFKKFDREVLWDFGDGTKVRGLRASHSYKQPGSYNITCTCFDGDGIPYQNKYPKTYQAITVTDIFDTTLSYTANYLKKVKAGLLTNIFAGETFEIGEFRAFLDKSIDSNVPIKCYTSSSASQNFFDLNLKTSFKHLLPYNTFFTTNNVPTLEVLPEYNDVYVIFDTKDNKLKLNLYILSSTYEKGQPFEQIKLDSKIPYQSETFIINSLDDLATKNYYLVGKVGRASILYRDDLPKADIKVSFVLDQSYFPKTNILLSKDSINLVSVGTSLEIKPNILSGNENIFISTNGLTTALGTEESPLTDSSIKNNTFSFYRAKYLGVEAPFVIRVISTKGSQYFIKDVKIVSIKMDNLTISPPNCLDIIVYDKFKSKSNTLYTDIGSCFASLIPIFETDKDLSKVKVNLLLEDSLKNQYSYALEIKDLTFISLKSFSDKDSKYYLDPKQDYIDYSASETWEAYKTHPLFEDIPVLDNYMESILGNNNFLENVINKGNNFVDDISNINVCSIKNLISILDSINLKIDLYNNENFSKPNVINELLKIFSICHSRLVGVTYKKPDKFEDLDNSAGKNRGKQLNLEDKIYIEQLDGKFIWPKLVCYDRFDKSYFILNTALLEVVPESPIKIDSKGSYFQLIDYFIGWGWGLLLGDTEFKTYNILSPKVNDRLMINLLTKTPEINKAREEINKFYYFYSYIETSDTEVKNAYLREETISKNIKDYNTWYKTDGSIDRLTYKTLIENLDLN